MLIRRGHLFEAGRLFEHLQYSEQDCFLFSPNLKTLCLIFVQTHLLCRIIKCVHRWFAGNNNRYLLASFNTQ